MSHDNEAYWVDRHKKLKGSLASVGRLGASEQENRQNYSRKKRLVADLLRVLDCLDLKGKNVLDAGCGIGLISELFYSLGASVSGVDTSNVAIEEATDRSAPDGGSGMMIVSSLVDFNFPRQFDITFCLDVLYHVVDDNNWSAALANLSKHTRTGGLLVVLDQLKPAVQRPAPHVCFRTASLYRNALTTLQMQQVDTGLDQFIVFRK